MEDVYYLVHSTDNPDCINWSELKTGAFNTDDQFPGVYLSIITKDNINDEVLFPGKYIIIFSKKILLQKNYHMNLTDTNGIVSETNTYFPWDLNEYVSKNKTNLNEVIFHDNIDMKYCCGIIGWFKKDIYIRINDFLPNISIENEEDPDMTKQPFVCYPFEDGYTGTPDIPRSSNKWYEMMATVCNIDDSNTREDLIKKIKDKAEHLYNNREEQNIRILKNYTICK
jgi:hypothetical protein